MKTIGTSTDDLNELPTPKRSKIPRLVNNHRIHSKRYNQHTMTRSQDATSLTESKLLIYFKK